MREVPVQIAAGDVVYEDGLRSELIAAHGILVEERLLGLEETVSLGRVADAKGHAFTAAAHGIAGGVLEERKQGSGP